jgi:CheY-like chemotaxis protein
MKSAGARHLAWVVDDHGTDRRIAKELLSSLRLEFREIGSQESFIVALNTAGNTDPTPDVILLDLRLPWADDDTLAANALHAGLGCLALLRQEPATAACPVVVFSAFVRDDGITRALMPYQPLTLVDKSRPASLVTKVSNLISEDRATMGYRLRRFLTSRERTLIRLGAVAGAIVAIATVVALLAKLLTGI